MAAEQAQTVRRRRVFYIPGYDPIHPRRYRELYRKESAAQAEISGYDIRIAPRRGAARYGWGLEAEINGAEVEAEVEVLVWSDIVRNSMSNSIPATYWQLARTAWTYIASGTLRRLMWLRKGPVIAALYPVGMLIFQLLIALLLAWAAATICVAVLAWIGLAPLAGYALALPVFVYALRWFRVKDNKLFAYYLMHDYAYSAQHGGANPPELEARMSEFTDIIANALTDEGDEVLVVGHSSGAHLAVSILADLMRAGRLPANGPALSFLSLGQVVPMVSFLPKADRLRADLHYLSQCEQIAWVDVTAPGDGCAFALCDPVAVSGVAPETGQKGPLILSAAFTKTLKPETWAKLRWRFFRLHFQYLCAFDNPGDYDYFQITAGPLTLGARYKGRKPSQSRIDVAASRYTSMAA
ncbi:putative integral membrane protein [Candidatus Rhodobacter oscarellae]|uniref:Putative integral membrane protein n=1 Tax=Candidatus Rhodobacter oscarellae TaxID=1675527 RepID=A0A0J9E449_9RHOB|nr:hypothetical protein [Candidatus Rhodobacter lobularis]KMW57497.1 putative integral membrane protein [Candidatus Rhodobacter lobularis]